MKGKSENIVDPTMPQTPAAPKVAGEENAPRKDVDEVASEFLNELNHLSVALERPEQQHPAQEPGDKQVATPADKPVEKGLALRTGESIRWARPAGGSAYLELILSQRRDDSRGQHLINPATHVTHPVSAPCPPRPRHGEGPGISDTPAPAVMPVSTAATSIPEDRDKTQGSPPPAEASATNEPFRTSLDLTDSGTPLSHRRLAIALASVTTVVVLLAGYHFLRPGPAPTPPANPVASDAAGSAVGGTKSAEEPGQDVGGGLAQPGMPKTSGASGPRAVRNIPRNRDARAATIPKPPAIPERVPPNAQSQNASAGSPRTSIAGAETTNVPVQTQSRDLGSQPEPAKPRPSDMPAAAPTEPSLTVSATLEPVLLTASLPSPTQTLNASPRPPSASSQLLTPATETSGDRQIPSGAKPMSSANPEAALSSSRGSSLPAATVGVTRPAAVISRVLPEYPREARASHTLGTVVVIVEVDEQGKVVKASAVSGPMLLRTAAEAALLKWRFKPAVQNGVTVSSRVSIRVLFE